MARDNDDHRDERDEQGADSAKRPSFGAYQVNEGKDGESYFNRVGAAFAHKDGKGHTIQLDALPLDGRIVLRTPQDRVKETREKDAPERSVREPRTRASRRDDRER